MESNGKCTSPPGHTAFHQCFSCCTGSKRSLDFVRLRISLRHYSHRINSRPRPKLPERPPDWVTKMLLCDYMHFQRCTTSNVMNADNGQPSATCPALDRYSRWQLSCEGCKKRWQAFQWVEPMAEGPRCEANFLSEFMRRPPPLDQHQLTIRDGFSHCNSLKCFRMPKHQVDRGPFMSICWLRVEKARQFSPARNNHLVNTIGWLNLPTTRLHTLTRTEGQMAVGACLPAAMHQIFFLYHNP